MGSEFYRDTWAEVDLDAIAENIRSIRKHLPSDVSIMAVVKANGYGHGALETAVTALENGASHLAVAFLDEAIFLRKSGINVPILVLGYCPPEYANIAAKNAISLTVFQAEWLKKAEVVLNEPLSIHIKCDTGMGRIGVRDVSELQEIQGIIQQSSSFNFDGIFTHFAKSDSLDTNYYHEQLDNFRKFLDILQKKPKWIHASNSAATLRYEESLFNLVRTGIITYGLSPSDEIKDLLPIKLNEAFSLHSKLVHVKKVKKGARISYGCTYTAETDEWIGTIPIGYADGWLRHLQGQEVLIEGIRVPIVGRICMDQCMVRLPYEFPVGTKVTLIGRQNGDFISVDEIAHKLQTINYEVVCTISSRIPRLYIKGNEIVKISNPLLEKI